MKDNYIQSQFVTYEIALALKELGFDEECFCTYHNTELSRNPSHKMDATPIQGIPYTWTNSKVHNSIICAPLWQQVIDWFREKHNLHIEFQSPQREFGFYSWTIHQPIKLDSDEFNCMIYEDGFTNDYYKSREEAILKAIELIKKQNGTN